MKSLSIALVLWVTGACIGADMSVADGKIAAPALKTKKKIPYNKYEVAGIEDAASVAKFLRRLQQAVARNNRAKVADMVTYPITVTIAKRKVTLRKRTDLLRRYNQVFNRKVKHAIAAQKEEKLFVNQQGVMIGDGEIWFNQPVNSKVLKIIAINN